MDKKTYPMAIIGGGIIGMSIAVTLQAAGVSVVVLEKDQIGQGASWGNAGHIATEQVFPIADPSILKSLPNMLLDPLGPLRLDWRYLPKLMPWAVQLLNNMRAKPFAHIHAQLQLLNGAALPAWQAFSERWGLQDLLTINGSLLVAEKTNTVESLKKHGDYLNSIGVQNKWLTKGELHEYEPGLSDTQLGGLFYPDTGHVVDLDEVFNRLKKQFIDMGGEIRERIKVLAIKQVGDELFNIVTEQGVITAEKIVIASGAFSKPFVRDVKGITVPLETERGYHLMLPKEKGRLSIPISSADRRFIMTPMANGLRLAGTVEYGGLKLPPNMQRAKNFIPLATPMLKTTLNDEDSMPWMGFRPTIADSLPVIDRQDNIYYAFGHQHLGLTHAALTAEMIKAMHFNQPAPIDPTGFSMNRFK